MKVNERCSNRQNIKEWSCTTKPRSSGRMVVTKEERTEGGRRASGVLSPPEGGWGWMVVAGCFLATICIRAVTRCVSMFFVEFQMHFEKDYSSTAWIHSMIDSTTMLCAPLGSFLGNRLSCRATVFLGGLLSSAGLILSSFASSLESLYVSLGVVSGLGFALSYTPAIAMVGRYFNERKALAYGIAMSGSGIGTFVLAPVVQLLIEHYSWRGALLILGGFVSNLCVCGALMRPLEQKSERMWENMSNVEKACMTAVLESGFSEQLTTNFKQLELKSKQQKIHNLKDTQGLVFAIGTFKSFGLENSSLQGNITLLPDLPDKRRTDVKLAECILFSNKLGTVLGEMEVLHPALSNDNMIEDPVESVDSNNTFAFTNAKRKTSEVKSIEEFDKIVSSEPLVNSQLLSRDQSVCFRLKEELAFLVIPNFLVLSMSFLFLAYGCSVPLVYFVPYALSVGVEHQHTAFLMSIFGISGIVGNITFGWITDRKCLKKYRILSYILAVGMEGLCCLFLPFLHSFSLLVTFSVIYGYFDGAYVALIPVVTSDIVGSTSLTSALGAVYFLHAIPYLVSPPIGGWLVDQTGNYASTFFLSSASFILSSLVLLAAVSVTHMITMCGAARGQKSDHSQIVSGLYNRKVVTSSNI